MSKSNHANRFNISGVILAGGKGRRMGGKDKGLVEFQGQPLIQHVIESLQPQVETVIINANRNLFEYKSFGFTVITDVMGDFQGPLAGILAAMDSVTTPFIVTVPCDGPALSVNLVHRLATQLNNAQADIAVAHDGSRLQPVYALISTRLRTSLAQYLRSAERKIDTWYGQHNTAIVDFSDSADTFININTLQERETLERG